MGSSDHRHITSAEIGAFNLIHPDYMSEEESVLFHSVLAKEECCEICRQRIKLYESLGFVIGEDSVGSQVGADITVARIIRSALVQVGKQVERARRIAADWADGLWSVVRFPQASLVPVVSGARGASTGLLDDAVMPSLQAENDEGVFEIELDQQKSLFIKMEIDEQISTDCEYTAIIVSDDQVTVFTLEFAPNRKGTMLITEQIELGPGRYHCIVLSGEKS